ncbi:MAG: molybdenum cofactor guanylyltransferase [Deltaproteobacteria bacterium]|nr:molybdenum cofactor guanylyltransferase [Deltaproteobacteria bacterium]
MYASNKDSNQIKPFIKGVTGVILAGGKSTRFGSNKALVEINGARLIERVTGVMGSIFKRLILITNTPQEYSYLGLPLYGDLIKGFGPLGGIYTGLEAIKDETGFFIACDMPFINEDLIRHIVEVRDDFDAVMPKIDWMIEPLYAVYTKRCLPAIKGLITSGERQIIKFFKEVRVRHVDEEEIRAFDPQLKSFININRPNELLDAISLESKK